MPDHQITAARARVAALARHGAAADRQNDAKRELAAARLAAHIRRTVDAAPPLTPAQRDRLALLLRAPQDAA